MFEDLAAEFKIQTKEVLKRIENLESAGRLIGITDDRGKYIHLSKAELGSVADLIQQKGRVSRTDLNTEVNKLVRMVPTEADKKAIEEERQSLLQKVQETMQTEKN